MTDRRTDRGARHPDPSSPREVLVVDEHRAFADLLALAVDQHPRLRCAGVETRVDGVLARLRSLRRDLAVVVVHLGVAMDLTAAEVVRSACPEAAIVVLATRPDPATVHRARSLGVSAVLDGRAPLTQVLQVVLTARHGRLGGPMAEPTGGPPDRPAEPDVAVPPLTTRERHVLLGLAQGHGPRAIASSLGISHNTCRGYVQQLLEKLGAHSQLEAVALARRAGLLGGLEHTT